MPNRIATYSQLTSEYPDKVVLKKLAEKHGTDGIFYHRALEKAMGPLFRISWYRIILDEAHAIKNSESSSKVQRILVTLGIFRATNLLPFAASIQNLL